ncbi:MAG: aminotransferase class IV [Roseovarius sp.]|nr:aminotransferase class IV [Roseovarius sp.]
MGCFSFQSYKLVNAGEGGIMVSDDADLVARAVIMSGAYEHNWAKHLTAADPALEAAFARWQNELPLYNMRMSNLTAAIIRPQIAEIPRRVRRGRANHDHVAAALDASPWLEVPAKLGPEERAPDSIQFNLVGMGEDEARAFADAAAARGGRRAGLRAFGRQRPRVLELAVPARRGARTAAHAGDADARLRHPPAGAAGTRGPGFHRRRPGRCGRRGDGRGARLRHLTGPRPSRRDGRMDKDFSNGAAWMRGAVVPIAEATIRVTDWALIHSDVTYDVVPVWDGGFFRLPDYLDRFEASMAAWRMQVGLSRDEIAAALHAMVARSGLRAAYVSMVAARGTPRIPGSRDPRDCANHFYAWCVPYVHVVKPEIIEAGATVRLSRNVRRIPEQSINPRVKNYHWGDFTQALFEAGDDGFDTVLLPDDAGNVTEGPGFNVFALKRGRVVTPARGCWPGSPAARCWNWRARRGLQPKSAPCRWPNSWTPTRCFCRPPPAASCRWPGSTTGALATARRGRLPPGCAVAISN